LLDPLVIIYGFAVAGLSLLLVYLLASCAAAPPCPPPVQHLTTVMSTCTLPPGPGKLPGAVRAGADAGCPAKLVCYDVVNAAAVAERNSRLTQWIRETKARCSALAPAFAPLDAGPQDSVSSMRDGVTEAAPPR
jgi:hypothetical protein